MFPLVLAWSKLSWWDSEYSTLYLTRKVCFHLFGVMGLIQDFLGKFEEGIPLLSNENTFGANPINKNKDFEDGWTKRSFVTSSSKMSIHMASYLRAWGEMALLFLTCSIWDGWMASLTRWTWVLASSGSWWWTGEPGLLQSMGLQRVGHDWATELNLILKFEAVAGVLQ